MHFLTAAATAATALKSMTTSLEILITLFVIWQIYRLGESKDQKREALMLWFEHPSRG